MYACVHDSSVTWSGVIAHVVICCVFRASQLFAELEMVLSNSSIVESMVDLLSDVNSSRSLGNYMLRVSNSCEYGLCSSAHCM